MTERERLIFYQQPNLDDLKAHLRVTSNDLDAILQTSLDAALESAEHFIGKTITRSRFTRTGSFSRTLRLRAPLIVVESVEVDGAALSSSDWIISDGRLVISDAVPTGGSLTIVYQAGMDSVPADIIAAVKLHAGALFNNPVDSVEVLAKASRNLLRPYRRWGLNEDED